MGVSVHSYKALAKLILVLLLVNISSLHALEDKCLLLHGKESLRVVPLLQRGLSNTAPVAAMRSTL